jgi:hypothetical protein
LNKRTWLAASFLAAAFSAHADDTASAHTLKIEWFKDGRMLVTGIEATPDALGQLKPYAMQSGNTTGYATCAVDSNGRKLTSHEAFAGVTLMVKPTSVDGSTIHALVSASDTVVTGKHETGIADCPSEVVDISGLQRLDIPVVLKDGETTEVPLDDPRYRLRITTNRE